VSGALAQGLSEAQREVERQRTVAANLNFFDLVFALPEGLPVDAGLRADALTLVRQQRQALAQRLQQQAAADARVGEPDDKGVPFPSLVFSRALEAASRWAVDTAGAWHRAWLAQQATSAWQCVAGSEVLAGFARRVWMIHRLPAGQRAAALADEAATMARYGELPAQGDARVPPLPTLLLPEPLRGADAASPPTPSASTARTPLPPAAAYALWRKDARADAPATDLVCGMAQWWFKEQMRSASVPESQALDELLYAWRPGPTHFFGGRDATRRNPPGDAAAYPPVATRFEVQGTVTVEIQLDAKAAVVSTRIAQRRLDVPGLAAGAPSWAFADVFDHASQARARAMSHRVPEPNELKAGLATRRLAFVWKLQ
jgi:hypothetical protein